MAQTLKILWPTGNGKVSKDCEKIIEYDNKYVDENLLSEDAKFIIEHIEDENIGKGTFAQQFAEIIETQINNELFKIASEKSNSTAILQNISKLINVPKYIEDAVIWSCGGDLHD